MAGIQGKELMYEFVDHLDLLQFGDVNLKVLQRTLGIDDISHCAFCGSKLRHVTILQATNGLVKVPSSEGCFDILKLNYPQLLGLPLNRVPLDLYRYSQRQYIVNGEVLSWKMMSGSQQQVKKMIIRGTIPGPGNELSRTSLMVCSIPKKYTPQIGDKIRLMGNFKRPVAFTGLQRGTYDYIGNVSRFEVQP